MASLFRSRLSNLRLLSPPILQECRCVTFPKLVRSNQQTAQRMKLHTSSQRNATSYEPDGKTTVTVLNTEAGAPLMIDAYSQSGFRLNNGFKVLGPMAIFPKTVLAWDVGELFDITPESLILFTILEPKPDVLVIGVGDKGGQLPLETVQFLKKRRINVEILSTDHACTTFNFLSGEGRCVAAAMIPPVHIKWTGADIANTKLKERELMKDDEPPVKII